jgi:hypothetical protein
MSGSTEQFDARLLRAARLAAHEWSLPPDDLERWVVDPLPPDLVADLSRGLEDGSVLIIGTRFRLRDLPPSKGPYTLFTRYPDHVNPNIEYFVEVAEFLRLRRALSPLGFSIGFEDKLMDVTVRLDNQLAWCIEAKETGRKVDLLLAEMNRYAASVPLEIPDRGVDGLRKAKYLVTHRPRFFSTFAMGRRDDFQVQYQGVGFAFVRMDQ